VSVGRRNIAPVSDLPAPDFDPGSAYPEIAHLKRAVVAGDGASVDAFFARCADQDSYAFGVRIAGEAAAPEGFLEDWAARETSSTLGRTLLASRLIELGWDIRSSARAQYVSRRQFDSFHEYLRHAERLLIEATALAPDNLAAWTLRMITARGLELGQAEARRRYDRAARTDPNFLATQTQLLQQLCPKWSGSFETMHAFALESMRRAPEGAPNAVLVLEGHLERWLDVGGGDKGRAYLCGDAVQQEITEAATRSVLHPRFRPGYRFAAVHNTFAMVFSLVGNQRAAATHFRALGALATRFPWAYLGDPGRAFRERRATALAKG
jgi:hypothetical protein